MSTNITIIENYLGKKIDGYEIISTGWDYEVILYDNMIYRFPRPDKMMDLALEKKKLDIIAPYITLPIPQFTIVDEKFITYPAIQGKQLTEYDGEFTDDMMTTLTTFMKELHSIPRENFPFMESPVTPTEEEEKGFRDRVQSMKDDVATRLATKVPEETISKLHAYMDELFFTYESPVKAFVHQDLQGKNIIYDPSTGQITGIIDFTDSRIGGIELDFCHFAFRSDDLLEKLLTKYMGHVDPEFVSRVEFLAKRGVIFEITNDEVYNNKFDYLLKQLRKYSFM